MEGEQLMRGDMVEIMGGTKFTVVTHYMWSSYQ